MQGAVMMQGEVPTQRSMAVPELLQALRQLCGADAVAVDEPARRLAAHDVFVEVPLWPAAVVTPRSVSDLASAVARITEAGLAVAPRGGGMSYTGGYLPRQAFVCIDLSKLTRIVSLNVADMYITVEAGCTWAQVREALLGSGLTTPYSGPLSGLRATVGGALSQNSMFSALANMARPQKRCCPCKWCWPTATCCTPAARPSWARRRLRAGVGPT